MTTNADVTRLLDDWSKGDRAALVRLIPVVHAELKRAARQQLRRERPGHTLQPTALVNELFLRLVEQGQASWKNRAQFFAVAAQLMRRILVDQARARDAAKRGGAAVRVSLTDAELAGEAPLLEVLAVDEALTRLAALDPTQARIVELRFFAGLSVEETAAVLGCSDRTVKREWRLAKAWLHRAIAGAGR